jgi:hypothetical protein
MSSTTVTRRPASPSTPSRLVAPRNAHVPVRPASGRGLSLTARASVWVGAMLWALPFAAAGVVALLATPAQAELVLLVVMSAVLLIPAGLVALVALRVLAGLGWRPPAAVLALAGSGCGVAAVGLLVLAGSVLV